MAAVEICCPHCGSSSLKKDGRDYCCNSCGRYFQIIRSQKKPAPKVIVDQREKYGKTTLELPYLKNVGRFVLAKTTLNFTLYMIFKFHVFKQIKRGNTIVEADLRGYFFTNPFTGKLNDVQYSDKGYHPQPNNIKDDLERECVRIIIDKAFEEKAPPIENENSPPMPPMAPGEKIYQDVFNWITSNLSVKKTYAVQSTRRYDLGLREVILTFKKKDVLEFGSLGVIAVPLFKLEYTHPDSSAIFKRNYLGYSGELVLDEIKCSKSNFLDSTCYDFPNNVCITCGKLICDNHTKKCERCGATVCKDCAVSKGLLSKHYYCSRCAG